MEKIRKYITRFIAVVKVNGRYDMSSDEFRALVQEARNGDATETVHTTFCYGYVKGYRAALAEMKKGGTV